MINHLSPAIPSFVLIDVLRSVHHGLPSTLTISELLSQPTPLNNDFNSIYSCTVFESRLPPPELSVDSAFLALVAILCDIHTLSTVFHPLGTDELQVEEKDCAVKSNSGSSHFHNPYLPFSPASENRQVNQKLHTALDLWSQSYLARVGKDTVALFYFCKMYLILPSLQLLPIIAGYPPRASPDGITTSYQTRIVDSELRGGSEALNNAWLILDNIEVSEDITPASFPVIVFYASLVVWRMISLQAGFGIYGSRKVFQLFKIELGQMKWPCCETMVETLESLMAS
jgi:hypothetical protein